MEYPGIVIWCRVGNVGMTFGREIRKRFGSHLYKTVSRSYAVEPGTKWVKVEWTGNFAKVPLKTPGFMKTIKEELEKNAEERLSET